MFNPLVTIKQIQNDSRLTYREKTFLTQVALHTDNKSGKIKATLANVARSAGVDPTNVSKLLKVKAVSQYVMVTKSGKGLRTQWEWNSNDDEVNSNDDEQNSNDDYSNGDEVNRNYDMERTELVTSTVPNSNDDSSTHLLTSTSTTTTRKSENSNQDAPKVASSNPSGTKGNSSSGSLLKEEVSKAKKSNQRNLFLGAEGLYNSLSLLLDSKEQYSSSLKFPLKELLEVHDSDYILLVAKQYVKVRRQHGGTCSIKHFLYKFDDYAKSYETVRVDLEQRRKLKEMRSSWSTGVSA